MHGRTETTFQVNRKFAVPHYAVPFSGYPTDKVSNSACFWMEMKKEKV